MIETNKSLVDAWTIPHFLTGCAAAALRVPLPVYFGAAVLFEFIEHEMEHPHGHPLFGTKRPESAENLLGDLVFGCLGYWTAHRLRVTATISDTRTPAEAAPTPIQNLASGE